METTKEILLEKTKQPIKVANKDLDLENRIIKLEKIKRVFKIILYQFAFLAIITFISSVLLKYVSMSMMLNILSLTIIISAFLMVSCLLAICILSSKVIELLKNIKGSEKWVKNGQQVK